jgi:DNA-binding CsgD family transcriptional regulator
LQDAIDSVRQLLNTLSRRQHGPILRSLPVGLTSSEAKVLQFVAQGKSNHQIAQELQISEKTVANHLSHIFYKTGSDNRAGAAAFVTKFPSWDRHFSQSMFFAVWAIGLAKSAFFPSQSELLLVIDSSSPFRTRTKMSNFSVALVSALGYTSSVSIQSGTHHSFREKNDFLQQNPKTSVPR